MVRTRTHARTHARTHTHAHTHARTHTHTRTHTHAHTLYTYPLHVPTTHNPQVCWTLSRNSVNQMCTHTIDGKCISVYLSLCICVYLCVSVCISVCACAWWTPHLVLQWATRSGLEGLNHSVCLKTDSPHPYLRVNCGAPLPVSLNRHAPVGVSTLR